jgi:hypothetical protein
LTEDFGHSINGFGAPACDEKPASVGQPIKEREGEPSRIQSNQTAHRQGVENSSTKSLVIRHGVGRLSGAHREAVQVAL